ncbi:MULTISPECIES: hypothetical protein [Porphyromonadaceae]|uniref:Beta-carotene 15,15'-monooxygenase n=1 Tax=Sanguibacteroides justesenii TaxID=1547597 RepID=A0A0C3RIY1_9PORP|nr:MULTISPECIES: hypothetical protein [Porphyromonadaceae]KIO46286.1 hypothetical protein IE90_05700 [Sanguibacteroides justesenii]KIO47531.1 hypothetical protein BA92_00510 [Sanguibacteroides justesenii]PXZ44346.1 hypothetical protein DMB45_06780 [Sanguibacteroides justesenii]
MSLNAIIKSKSIYMLYLLPFLVIGIAFFRYWLGGEYTPCGIDGLISLSFLEAYEGSFWLDKVGLLLLLSLAFLLFFIADRYKFLSHVSVLPSFLYSLLTVGVLCHYGVNAYLFAAFFVALAVAYLQSAIVHFKTNAPVFNFGFFIALSVLLCPDLFALVPWAVVVLPFSGRATLKDMVALLLGFGTMFFLVWGYYFLSGDSGGLFTLFWDKIWEGDSFIQIVSAKPIVFIIIGILIFASFGNVLINYPTVIVAQRRGLLSMLSMLFFLGGSMFIIPCSCYGGMYIVAIPLVYLFSQYFISHHTKWAGNMLFLLLLVACGWLIFG